jgi:hypothetical protein
MKEALDTVPPNPRAQELDFRLALIRNVLSTVPGDEAINFDQRLEWQQELDAQSDLLGAECIIGGPAEVSDRHADGSRSYHNDMLEAAIAVNGGYWIHRFNQNGAGRPYWDVGLAFEEPGGRANRLYMLNTGNPYCSVTPIREISEGMPTTQTLLREQSDLLVEGLKDPDIYEAGWEIQATVLQSYRDDALTMGSLLDDRLQGGLLHARAERAYVWDGQDKSYRRLELAGKFVELFGRSKGLDILELRRLERPQRLTAAELVDVEAGLCLLMAASDDTVRSLNRLPDKPVRFQRGSELRIPLSGQQLSWSLFNPPQKAPVFAPHEFDS